MNSIISETLIPNQKSKLKDYLMQGAITTIVGLSMFAGYTIHHNGVERGIEIERNRIKGYLNNKFYEVSEQKERAMSERDTIGKFYWDGAVFSNRETLLELEGLAKESYF